MEQWIYEAILAVVKEPTKENARIVAKSIFSEIENRLIDFQEAKDLLAAITCYLLCDFGVQDVEMQAQAAAEKERILIIQNQLKELVGE